MPPKTLITQLLRTDLGRSVGVTDFTCKLWMMKGGTLLILGQGVKGHGTLCPPPPCEGISA